MYDHRIGVAALCLLALPFALTFILIALIGLTTTFLLLGHMGTVLSHVLQLALPIPALTSYLDTLSSPYSLLVATILVVGIGAAWIYFALRFDTKMFPIEIPHFWRTPAVEKLRNDEDDRTVIHHLSSPPTNNNSNPHLNEEQNPYIRRVPYNNTDHGDINNNNNNPHLNEEQNPYIRRVSRNNNTDQHQEENSAAPIQQHRLRADAGEFGFRTSLDSREQQQSVRTDSGTFEPDGARFDATVEGERVPSNISRIAGDGLHAYDRGVRAGYLVARRPDAMESAGYGYEGL